MSKIAFLIALCLGAAALMPAVASAKSGPSISSNVKLLKCHTYVRGHGDHVTVCN